MDSIIRTFIGILFLSFVIKSYGYFQPTKNIMKSYHRILNFLRRLYRLCTIKNVSKHVWRDLVEYHDNSKWSFGKYEKEKRIECNFKINDTDNVDFEYSVDDRQFILKSTLLHQFDEEITDDVFILASHFNTLLNFGVVRVSVKYNFVSYEFSRDLLVYYLYSGEISRDTDYHFNIAKDCYWAFKKLVETGVEPVFIISELLKRNDEKNNQNKDISN